MSDTNTTTDADATKQNLTESPNENIAAFDQPLARDGVSESNPMRAKATTLQFPDIGVTIEQGDDIVTDDRGTITFDYAVMDERGYWTVVYTHGPGGHGYGWLKMQLRRGTWVLAEEYEGVQDL